MIDHIVVHEVLFSCSPAAIAYALRLSALFISLRNSQTNVHLLQKIVGKLPFFRTFSQPGALTAVCTLYEGSCFPQQAIVISPCPSANCA